MTVASVITLGRILLIPLFLALLWTAERGSGQLFAAAALFLVAAVSDALDGYFARVRREVTRLGALIDPVADKLLISSALIALVERGWLTGWIAILIIGREFAISGLRLVMVGSGADLPVSGWGKSKTLLQIVAILALLVDLPYAMELMWIATGVTVLSGLDYFRRAASHFT